MDNVIMNQIQILQEMKARCIEVCGFYGDIDTAIAALQICSTLGMDNTARLIAILNNNSITNQEHLLKLINDSILFNAKKVIENEFGELQCPSCKEILIRKSKHCDNCGQSLNFEHVNNQAINMINEIENNNKVD